MASDTQYQDSIITAVTERENGYEISHDDWTVWCPKVGGLEAPKVGERLRLYGRGLGFTVRGIVVEDRVYSYLTEAQEAARHDEWCRQQEAIREKELSDNLVERDRRITALPEVFRARITKFQNDGGHEFRRDFEGYELFCCEQAVEIAKSLKTREAVKRFQTANWEAQKILVPNLSDDHSGNTFGVAIALAYCYLENLEFVSKLHGALTPLVGCEKYGCKHDVKGD